MIKPEVARVGSVAAYGIGIVHLLFILVTILEPSTRTVDEMMQVLAEKPIYHYLRMGGFALIALLFIPVIAALRDVLEETNAGIVRWATAIGYIGCAGTIINRLRLLTLVPLRARAYVQGDEVVQTAILYNWEGNSLDPAGWLQYGAIGLWLFIISQVALREGQTFTRGWAYLGLVGAVLYFAVFLSLLAFPVLQPPAATLGGIIVAPLWAILTGRRLKSLALPARDLGARREAV